LFTALATQIAKPIKNKVVCID